MKIDMIGYKTERLEVIESAGSKNGKRLWKCQCSCGNICYHTTSELRTHKPNSCGCIQKEKARELAPSAGKNRKLENGSCLNSYNAKLSVQNTSSVTGVSFYKKSNKWKVQIKYNYKNYYLGLYENFEYAVSIRKDAEEYIKEHFGNHDDIVIYLSNISKPR